MTLLKVKDLHVRFAAPGTGFLGMNRQWLTAVNGVSLTLSAGETLGLVGESGRYCSTASTWPMPEKSTSSGCVMRRRWFSKTLMPRSIHA
jgi:ABC-type oligopeptide transport system ATPase subunit